MCKILLYCCLFSSLNLYLSRLTLVYLDPCPIFFGEITFFIKPEPKSVGGQYVRREKWHMDRLSGQIINETLSFRMSVEG